MSSKDSIAARFQIRRGMSEAEAALYVGIGATLFRSMVDDGRMPKPRLANSRKLWDIDELDAAFKSLPRESEIDTWADLKNENAARRAV